MRSTRFCTLLAIFPAFMLLAGTLAPVAARGTLPIDQTSGGASQTVDVGGSIEQTVDGGLLNDLLTVLLDLLGDILGSDGSPPATITLATCEEIVGGSPRTARCTLSIGFAVTCKVETLSTFLVSASIVTCNGSGAMFECSVSLGTIDAVMTPQVCRLAA